MTATAARVSAPPLLARTMTSMVVSYAGAMIALLVPVSLLLTLHLSAMVGKDHVAGALGLVTGCGAVAAMLVNPIAGRISDRTRLRFGRRRTWILFGGVGGAVVVTATGFTTELWQVVVAWSLVQAMFNFQLATTGALMADQVPADRRGAISGALGFTVAFSPLLGLGAVSAVSGALQWLVLGLLALVCAVLAVVLLREPRPPAGERPPLSLRSLVTSFWLNPRRHPAFGWAWAVRFLVTAAGSAFGYNGVYLLQRMDVAEDRLAGLVLGLSALYVGLGACASLAGGVLSDRFHRQKPFVVLAAVLSAVGLITLAVARSMPLVYVATAISALGAGVFLSVDVALSTRMLPNSADVGKDFAVLNLASTLPQSLVPFAAPALLALGGFPALYLVLGVLGVLGGLCVLRLPELGREGDPRYALLDAAPKEATP
ncbi:MFS transporter [Amycolatopsis sp. NPDC088138]|uniref:MFS transporter n=1 Tax=Amycolatopsis sp. NPDC088138 TaxID=3363938 RepID=UPI0037F72AD9